MLQQDELCWIVEVNFNWVDISRESFVVEHSNLVLEGHLNSNWGFLFALCS